MKEIKAIIRPHRVEAVLRALHDHPEFPGVTVSPVRGFGRRVGRSTESEPIHIQYGTAEMTKLECVVAKELVETIVGVIRDAAHTGGAGDGKIFVSDVEDAVRISTGDRGPGVI